MGYDIHSDMSPRLEGVGRPNDGDNYQQIFRILGIEFQWQAKQIPEGYPDYNQYRHG
jgi:hypothetical protein